MLKLYCNFIHPSSHSTSCPLQACGSTTIMVHDDLSPILELMLWCAFSFSLKPNSHFVEKSHLDFKFRLYMYANFLKNKYRTLSRSTNRK